VVRSHLDEALRTGQSAYLVLSGSVPSAYFDEVYPELISFARDRGIVSVLDARGRAFQRGVEACPTLAKCNAAELAELLGRSVPSVADAIRSVAPDVPIFGVTLGDKGAYVRWDREVFLTVPPRVRAVNPVGSGDCFLAGMILGLVNGLSREETLRLATAAGTANAACWKAADIFPPDVSTLAPSVSVSRV